MSALVCAGAVRAGIAYASGAWAEPRVDPRATYKRAAQLASNGAVEDALALIDVGLAAAPTDLPLLGLNGTVRFSLYDYAGAFTTCQEYLDAGARGANHREAQKIVDNLRAVQSTFLDATVANGPATVNLDSSPPTLALAPAWPGSISP